MNYRADILCLLLIFLIVSCKKETQEIDESIFAVLEIPRGFPMPEFPEDNEFTIERWELGKELFYNKSLSRDESISCAHCHNQSLAFTDGKVVSDGVDGLLGNRNSPSLSNIGYNPYFTREGGVATLEMQIAVPIQEHVEFDFNIVDIAERLQVDDELNLMSHSAYDRDIDPFVITRAIATFERSLISGSSRFDRFYFDADYTALSQSEKRGMNLFYTSAKCIACHSDFNFTNYAFENNGLYLNYPDSGRYRLTLLEEDIAKFKVPSLRNVEFTAPYMYDGSLTSLEDVVEHYSSGIQNHMNKNVILENLSLTDLEKLDLVNFLKSLSDYDFITNQKFQEE